MKAIAVAGKEVHWERPYDSVAMGMKRDGRRTTKDSRRRIFLNITFKDRTAVVTGGATGIGAAVAELLFDLEASVAILDCDEERGRGLVERLNGRGESASFYSCDVTDAASVQAAMEAAALRYGALHVLVHSAGIQRYGDIVSTSLDAWHEVQRVHVDGCFHALRFALPHMTRAGGGAAVIVGSVQSVAAVADSAAYVTAKHALLGLTRSVALDYARQGVRVNCVLPGAVDTPMLHWAAGLSADPEAVMEGCRHAHPMGRIGQPAEIARAIAFLASDWASFITGAALAVDGGMLVPAGGMAFQESGTGSVGKR